MFVLTKQLNQKVKICTVRSVSILSMPKKSSIIAPITSRQNSPVHTEQTTEERILQAAMRVFVEHGFTGARTQDIADRAGINKALLHYYFRSKEQLFKAMFASVIQHFQESMTIAFAKDQTLEEIIRQFVALQIDMGLKYPGVLLFVLTELHRHPALADTMQTDGILPVSLFHTFEEKIRVAVRKKEIRHMSAQQLIFNLVSLDNFPFIAQPLLQRIAGLDDNQYRKLLEARKKEVADFILHALRP